MVVRLDLRRVRPWVYRFFHWSQSRTYREGRDAGAIAAIGDAFSSQARLLDVHSDSITIAPCSLLRVSTAMTRLSSPSSRGSRLHATSSILRRHEGVHPRVGAVDVVPLVPIRPGDMGRACAAALALGERLGEELGLPVFLYGEVGEGRRPAFFRRGGPGALQARVDAGELTPDFGPRQLDPSAGAVLVGSRAPLVAFNVDLATADVEVARAIAATVRESSGGFPGVPGARPCRRRPGTGTA